MGMRMQLSFNTSGFEWKQLSWHFRGETVDIN